MELPLGRWRTKSGLVRPEVAITAVVIGSVTAAVGVTTAVAEPGYPTWQDVENAKGDEAATAAKVEQLSGLLDGLEATAAEAGRQQQIAAEKYRLAADALDAANRQEADLQAKAAEAEERAKVSKMRAGLLAAHLARTAGGELTLNLALNGATSDDLLYQLGAMTKLSAQSQSIYDDAITDQKQAESYGEQAQLAREEREKLSAAAQDALDQATDASTAAATAVTEQESRQNEMLAQLAALKGTTAAAEASYRAGLAAEKEQQEEQAADPAAPISATDPAAPANPSPSDPAPVAPTPAQPAPAAPAPTVPDVAAPVVSKVSTAIAFARAQIGEPYQLNGAGPNGWDCSGLTLMAYSAAGVSIGTHSATNQYNTARSRGQLVPYSQVQPGDLIFYSEDGSDMYHVTMYTGNGKMIEAPYVGASVREVTVRSSQRVAYVARPTA